MALIDVVKYNPDDDNAFVWKFPSEDLRLGTQVVVNEGQEAIFFKSGVALDILTAGTHTLSTGNIPLLNKIINLPFGGNTPFTAEVWYVNITVKRDLKWGTSSPIPLRDPLIGLPVNVRAFGKWGAKIIDSRSFVTQITGAQVGTDASKIRDYFTGEIIQKLTTTVASAVVKEKISIMDINAYLNELSAHTKQNILDEFSKYGLDVVNFNIESINLSEEDMKNYQDKFNSSSEVLAAKSNNVDFNTVKSFEILKASAENPGAGSGLGAMLNAGIGLGVGLPLGQQMAQNINVQQTPINQDDPMIKLKKLKLMLDEDLITQDIYNAKRDEILKNI
jgi:regulator of protease activity HflC (stomatin/prohibitin superfamily)